MVIGSIYPDFMGVDAVSYFYRALIIHFQLKEGSSLIIFVGFFITNICLASISVLYIQEVFSDNYN